MRRRRRKKRRKKRRSRRKRRKKRRRKKKHGNAQKSKWENTVHKEKKGCSCSKWQKAKCTWAPKYLYYIHTCMYM